MPGPLIFWSGSGGPAVVVVGGAYSDSYGQPYGGGLDTTTAIPTPTIVIGAAGGTPIVVTPAIIAVPVTIPTPTIPEFVVSLIIPELIVEMDLGNLISGAILDDPLTAALG